MHNISDFGDSCNCAIKSCSLVPETSFEFPCAADSKWYGLRFFYCGDHGSYYISRYGCKNMELL